MTNSPDPTPRPTGKEAAPVLNRITGALQSPRGRIGFSLSAANYLQAALGFAINFFLANRLGAAGYGLLSYGIVLGTVLYTLVNFGAERTLVRDLVQGEDRHATMTASLILRMILALVVLALVTGVVRIVDLPGQKRSVILLCTGAAMFWSCAPVAWFDAHYRMHQQAWIAFAEKVFYGALVLWGLTRPEGATAVTVAAFLLLARSASLTAQLLAARRTWRPTLNGLVGQLRWLGRQNVFIVLAALANLALSHWNQLLLEHRLSTAALGYYALAFQMISIVVLLQNQIVRILFPRVAELVRDGADPDLARRKLKVYVAGGWVLSALLMIPLLVAAPWVLRRFFSPDYAATLPPLRLLAVWAAFFGGARLVNVFLVNLRLDRQYLWCSLAAGATAVLLGFVLIPRYGATGVALALVLSHPVTTGLQWYFVERELRRRRRESRATDTEVPFHES